MARRNIKPKLILDLKPGECKWPVGEDKLGRFLFCAHPVADFPGLQRFSWCVPHLEKTFSNRMPIKIKQAIDDWRRKHGGQNEQEQGRQGRAPTGEPVS